MTERALPRSRVDVPAVYMRGGTSKGLFFREADLPTDPRRRDELVVDLMGSPDPMQLDGMGGGVSSLSKVMVVSPGTGGFDLSYRFGQVAVGSSYVDWTGNCGNLTAAVPVFALEEGIVARPPAGATVATVRMRNENTGVEVVATVRVSDGLPLIDGDFQIAGISRPGAEIRTMYLEPGGGVLGRSLPTGHTSDVLQTSWGELDATLLDITNPHVLVRAKDVGLDLSAGQSPAELNGDPTFLAAIETVRAAAAVRMGLATDLAHVGRQSPVLPRVLLVGRPTTAEADLAVMGLSLGKVHRALMMTGALCAAASIFLPGTIAADEARQPRDGLVRLAIPNGVVDVLVQLADNDELERRIGAVGVSRTARRLMAGLVSAHPRAGGTW